MSDPFRWSPARSGTGTGWVGAAVLACLLVSGCASTGKVKPQFVFDCGDGRTVKIEYRDKAALMLMEYAGKVFRLPRAISASGARYSDGRVTFWEKGGTAFIEMDGKIVEKRCVLHEREGGAGRTGPVIP